jgi:SSS family solute:Na+ symporter
MTDAEESQIAKWVSLIVKLGALAFILFVATQYALNLQLLGGVWIIQTLPAVLLGVYTRKLNDKALLIGWAVGMLAGTWMAFSANLSSTFPLSIAGFNFPGYAAFYSLMLNLVVTLVLTPVFNAGKAPAIDETVAADYEV